MIRNYFSKDKRKTAIIILVIILLSVAAVIFYLYNIYSAKSDQPLNSGIAGSVMLGPLSPVVSIDDKEPDEKPYPDAVILVKDSKGEKTITKIISDADGNFRILLKPGVYLLDPQSPQGQMLPFGSPQTVEVKKDQFTEVTIQYDTGIR